MYVLFLFLLLALLFLPLSAHHDFEALPSILPILDTSITSSSSSSKRAFALHTCVYVPMSFSLCAQQCSWLSCTSFLYEWKKWCFSSWLPFSRSHLHGCVECPYRLSHTKLGCWCECSFAGPAVNREKKATYSSRHASYTSISEWNKVPDKWRKMNK